MAAPAGPRPGWSRRAQYSLFFGFLAAIAGLIVGLFMLVLSLVAPASYSAVRGAARLAGARHRPLPGTATEWFDRLPENGRHLALLDASQVALAELERRWFAPLLGALRAGRIGMVTLHVPDGAEEVSFETIRGDLRRFWRRAKPIEHYA